MSHHDEAYVSGPAIPDPGTPTTAGHGKKPKKGSSWIFLFIGVAIGAAVGWGLWPDILYCKKIQPFDFSHKAHVEKAGQQCEECHKFTADGRFTGVPKFADCLQCHTHNDRQNKDNKNETEFLVKFVTEDGELKGNPEWHIYSAQPDCAYFSHTAHVKMGKIKCEECHGDHQKTDKLRPFYQNWLTGYSLDVTRSMKMTDCADCHKKRGKPENNACFVCHK
ncbi:MAG: cytochrome c3 family protein [Deltaproteobacteria bacterium]|nr:cytochrome c3 family protein [Deltaproteobacteria bacterium]